MRKDYEPPPRWDWISTMLLVLAVALILVVTFEIWAPHPGSHP